MQSAIGKITIRRRDGTLVAGPHGLVQPGLDADIILFNSIDGAGPLVTLVPSFRLGPPVPWEGGATLHSALTADWHVFPEPSASNSSTSGAQYLAVRRGEDELLLQYLPPMSHTSCHKHLGTTEIIAALAGECYHFHTSESGTRGAGRITTSGMQFDPGVSHCLWTNERPAINIITMRGRNVLQHPMTTRLVMDMSDHHPVELPPLLHSRNRLR